MGAILRPFPNTLITGRGGRIKPAGIPKIDWTHPLTRGLLCYWFDTGGIVIDLVTGRIAVKSTGAVTSFPVHATTPWGTGSTYGASGNTAQSCDPVAASNQALAAPYSIAAGFISLGASTASVVPTYFGLIDASGNDCVAIYAPSTTTVGIGYGNSASPFSFTTATNTFYVVVGSATGASAQSSWVNGIAQTAGAATSLYSGSAQHYVFGGDAYNATSTALGPNATMFFGATWQGRALTQRDATLLYTDPYCFLLPAESELPTLSSGAAVGFSMAAASGYYVLAQEQKLLAKAAINYPQAASFALTDEAEKLQKGSFYKPQAGFYLLNSAALTALDPSNAGTTIALSNGNLTATGITSTANSIVRSVAKESSGKFYCEFTCTSASANATGVGICDGSLLLNGVSLGATLDGLGFENSNGTTGHVYINNNPTAIQGYNNGDNVGMAVDFDDKTIWFRTNGGNWNNSGAANPATNAGGIDISSLNAGPYYAAVNTFAVGDAITANFGATAYSYTVPAGFFNWGAFTGGNEKLTKASKLTAQSTPYALTDEQLTALRTATAKLQTDFYTVIGGSPTLTFTITTAFSITLSTGSYVLTDEAETLKAGRLDVAQTALYTLTDEQLQTRKGYRAKIQTNFYALTVEQEKILGARKLFPQETPFAFVGGSFSLTTTISLQILLSAGSYAITDETEKLLRKALILPQTTPYALNFDGQLPADLLLHMDGTFTDATGRHTAVVTLGTVTIDTSKSVFGGASAKFANNSQLAFQNNRADFQFGTGDYTIDGWWYFTDLTNFPIFIEWDMNGSGIGTDLDNATYEVDNTGSIIFFVNDAPVSGLIFQSPAGVITTNAWYHVAFIRVSGIFRCFVNGIQVGTDVSDVNNFNLPTNDPYIGPVFGAAGSWLDEFRVVNGVAAWTSNFMVPSQPYTELGDETLLKASLDKAQSGMYALTDEAETLLKTSTLMPQTTPYLVNTYSGVDDARSFNGSSDYIDAGTGAPSSGIITGSFWINPSAYPSSYAGLVCRSPSAAGINVFLTSAGRIAFYIGAATGNPFIDSGATSVLSTGTWYNIIFFNDVTGGTFGWYVNNSLDGSAAGAGNLNSQTGIDLLIGQDTSIASRFFNGAMSDITLWNTILTSGQRASLASGARANTVASANIIFYLPILGQSPEPDESGNGNNGTVSGTTIVVGPPALDAFGGTASPTGYETLLWDRADNTQSVPYHLNTEPTDLARAFNGTTDYIDLGTHTWDPTTSATFSSWVYIVALPATYGAGLFSTNNPNPAIFYLRNSGALAFYIFNNWGNAANDPLLGGPTLSTGQWYHFAWTVVSGGNLNFYLNGTPNGSFAVGAGGGGSSVEQALLGQDITSGSLYPFNGYMSDIALWNTVLTGTQISNLAAGQRANMVGANANLIMNLPITGSSPEPDISGSQGRYGTLNGTSVIAGPPTLQSFTPIEGYETLLKDSADYPQAGFYNLKVESLTLTTLVPFLMVLGTGTYLLTDESLVLIKTSRLGAQTGIYSLNDEQLRTLKGSRLKDTAGTYSIVGEQLTLKAARKANLQATFYNLAGEAVTLIAPAGAFAMNIGTGAYVLTDETLTLLKGSHLYPQRVPYNITEFNTIIPQSFFLFPNTAYYALTDEQETLLKASTNNVQVGTYQLTDEQLALLKGLKLQGTAGFYTFNGEQLTLKATRLEHPQTGLYSLLEPSFSLTIPGQFFMTVTSGSYAVTDGNETLLKASHVTIQPISYAFTVETEQTLRAAATFPQAGSYALTPEQLREIKKSRLSPQAVTYSLVIENEQLLRGRPIGLQTGSYTLTGKQIADAIKSVSMKLVPGTYLLTVEALQVSTTAPVIIVNFTATPMLLGREADSTLKGGEVEPELEGQIS